MQLNGRIASNLLFQSSKVTLYPSPSFVAMDQLSLERKAGAQLGESLRSLALFTKY